jgi:hypothetical protein
MFHEINNKKNHNDGTSKLDLKPLVCYIFRSEWNTPADVFELGNIQKWRSGKKLF